MNNKQKKNLNQSVQVLLPIVTISSVSLTAFERPDLGLLVGLVSQIFWVYSAYFAWKKAKQFGMFATSVIVTVIIFIGVLNYWVF